MLRRTVDEYKTIEVPLSDEAARVVREIGRDRVLVTLGSEDGTWAITATSYVGTLATPDLELLVRPKASLHNVFQMLDVAPESFDDRDFALQADRSLLAIIADLFARSVERAVGTGLLRSYREAEERLMTMRGRIDVAGLIRRPALPAPIPCRFDEYTADILENRALRAALRRLLQVPGVRPQTRRSLSLALARFEEVEDRPIDVRQLGDVVYTRLNRHYRHPLKLASIVLRNLTFLDRLGSADASGFMVNMNDLFQDWIADRLDRHLRGRLAVCPEPDVHLGTKQEVNMSPDLVFMTDDVERYVADVKYKLTWTGKGRSDDYYQLLAYTTAMDLPEGLLIYCQAEGGAPDREVVVRHAGKLLRTHPINLSGSPAEAEAAVGSLADLIWDRARATTPQPILIGA